MLGALGAGHGIALHHQHGLLAHRVLVDDRLVAGRQAERGHQHAHGKLGRKSLKSNCSTPAQFLGGAARDVADRIGQALEIARIKAY